MRQRNRTRRTTETAAPVGIRQGVAKLGAILKFFQIAGVLSFSTPEPLPEGPKHPRKPGPLAAALRPREFFAAGAGLLPGRRLQ